VVGSHFAGDGCRFGKLGSLGLRDVEDIYDAEAYEHGCWLVAWLGWLLVALSLAADHRSQNRDALLALLDVTAKLVPSANARNVCCVGAMVRDGKNVSKAVVVEPGHGAEVRRESLALALLKLLDQVLDVLGNDLLSGGLLAAAAQRRIFAVRRGVAAAAVDFAVVVAIEIHAFVLRFRRNRLSVFLTHGWEARGRLAEKGQTQRTTVGVRREKHGQCQTRTLFGAQPRSERTEKARSAHSLIVCWAVHLRVRSGM